MNEPLDSVSNNNNNNNTSNNNMPLQSQPAESPDNIEMAHDQVDSACKQGIRKIQINRQLQDVKFKRNSISTSKYNLFTFLPKFLFEQFQKYSNIFFFAIVMLQVAFLIWFELIKENKYFLKNKFIIMKANSGCVANRSLHNFNSFAFYYGRVND